MSVQFSGHVPSPAEVERAFLTACEHRFKRAMVEVEGEARRRAPFRTGHLRRSITSTVRRSGTHFEGFVGTNLNYACLAVAGTNIITEEGLTPLGKIEPGDKVLTQTGEFRRVLAKTTFLAREKPELVDLRVEWRADDRDHHLTLTADHKVLVWREGRNRWLPAVELRPGDEVYDRKKVPHNKGAGKPGQLQRCRACGREYRYQYSDGKATGQGRIYCSVACRAAYWREHGNPHLGRKRSLKTRAKLAAKAVARSSGATLNRRLAERGLQTQYELAVKAWLDERGAAYEEQKQIGRHVVDFYLPGEHRVIEADGAFWHRDQERDIQRDASIRQVLPGVRITHLHFFSERFTPPLDPAPTDDVEYMVCNPGPKSFVESEVFARRRVLEVRPWRYRDEKSHPKDGRTMQLCDLAVEGVHSFVANGIVVSNSYLEYGTGLYGPKHRKIVPTRAQALRFPAGGRASSFSGGRRIQGFAGRGFRLSGSQRAGTAGAQAQFVFVKSVKGVMPMHFFEDAIRISQGRVKRELEQIAPDARKALGMGR